MKLPSASIVEAQAITRRFDIKMLTTLLKPTSGTARVGGFDINTSFTRSVVRISLAPRKRPLQ
jgi:hypothetical protein